MEAIGGVSAFLVGIHYEYDGTTGTGAFHQGDTGARQGFPFTCVLDVNVDGRELGRPQITVPGFGTFPRQEYYTYTPPSILDVAREIASFTYIIAGTATWTPDVETLSIIQISEHT